MRLEGGTVVNYFLILGISESAGETEVKDAVASLSESLRPDRFTGNVKAQAEQSIRKITEAGTVLSTPDGRAKHAEDVRVAGDSVKPEQLKCLIGHLCVAAGIISYKDLLDAISKQTDIDLPLGQILQERRLLSQTELEGMLMGQKLYGIPNRPLDYNTKRLMELGLVSLDMVKIAVIDQQTSMDSIDQLLLKRGFVDPFLIAALTSGSSARN